MLLRSRPALAGLLTLLALTAACDGDGPTATEPAIEPAVRLSRLDCTVTVADGAMACRGATPSTGDARGLIVGGQGTYVFLQATNHTYLAADNVFSIDVTVQNLMAQALGTTDGTTLDGGGVKVLFDQEPYPAGGDLGETVTVLGVQRDFLMRANQAYYQYDEIIAPNQTSSVKTWEFSLPAAVTSFRFVVYVMAQVPHPQGYVTLTPPLDTLAEGATVALTASVHNAYGDSVTGQAITWGSSDAGVATVSASGVVTAVAPGTASITATAGARTGATTIVVCPSLDVGEAYTAVMPAASSLCLAGAEAATAEYTYMPVNLSAGAALSLSVTGAGITGVAGPPSPSLLPGGAPLLNVATDDPAGDALHVRMMEQDRALAARLAGNPAARVTRGDTRRAPGGPSRAITPGVPAKGDIWTLNTAQGCTGTPVFTGGRVMSVGQHVVIVADTLNPAGGFTEAQFDSIAAEFDNIAYPLNTANFGDPTDLDGNGRVVAFYTRAVNALTPPGSGSVVGGFFTARDLFSSAPTSCPKSNEGEIFYMLAPDPAGINGNVRTVASVRQGTVATMGHELQHLINAARRVYVQGTQTFEEVWLNEGLSHVVEELMFYHTAGLAPRGNVGLSAITASQARINAYNAYQSQNFGRLRSWLARPDTAGPVKNNDALAVRGAIWAFLRYAADRRNADDAQLWNALVNTTLTGRSNLQNVLGASTDEWVRDFISAMYADDAVAGIGAAQQIPSWNSRSVFSGIGTRVYPLQARPLANGTALTISYSRGGGSGFLRFGVPAGGFAGVTALSAGLPPTSPYALVVVRTK